MYGRENQLYQLNKERNHVKLPMWQRKQADRAFNKIAAQLKDTKLMSLRSRLIKATQAGDVKEMNHIQGQMKHHQGEDTETYEWSQHFQNSRSSTYIRR